MQHQKFQDGNAAGSYIGRSKDGKAHGKGKAVFENGMRVGTYTTESSKMAGHMERERWCMREAYRLANRKTERSMGMFRCGSPRASEAAVVQPRVKRK